MHCFCFEVEVRRAWQLLRGNKQRFYGGYFARLPRGTQALGSLIEPKKRKVGIPLIQRMTDREPCLQVFMPFLSLVSDEGLSSCVSWFAYS